MHPLQTAPAGNEETGRRATFSLEPVLDLRAATPLHGALMQRRGAPLALDGANVERLGAQCAAILLSARRSWASDGHAFTLIEPSQKLEEGLRLLGLDPADLGADPQS